MTMLKQKT